jgi:hypothetical protein
MSYGGEYNGETLPGVPPPASARYGNRPSRNALRNTVNIYRLKVPNLDADGGQQNSWNLLYQNLSCSVQSARSDREEAQGSIQSVNEYGITFGTNPLAEIGDLVVWVDDVNTTHYLSVTSSSPSNAGRGSSWRLEVVERN